MPETDDAMVAYLIKILQEFTDRVKSAAEGGEYGGLEEEFWLFTSIREEYENFAKRAHGVIPRNNINARNFKRALEEKIRKCRGRELPYFMKYSVCEEEIQKLVNGFQGPAFECLEKVGQLVSRVFAGLAHECLHRYPTLEIKIKGLVDELRQDSQGRCEKELKRLLQMEHNVFTQDSNYKMIRFLYKKEEEETRKPELDSSGDKAMEETDASSRGYFDDEGLGVKNADDMCKMILAYMEVCERRLIDAVPMNITYYMLTELVSAIRLQVQQVTRKEEPDRLLEEDLPIARRRRSLNKKRQRLSKAVWDLAKLLTF